MVCKEELRERIETNYPILWTLLNKKAKRNLPRGLFEYISGGTPSEIEAGRNNLKAIERYLEDLENICGLKSIGDNYRRDFSGLSSENQLAELLCEVALCASLGKLTDKLELHPATGKGTYSDCLFKLHGFDIYAEAKRYSDPLPHIEKPGCNPRRKIPYKRSIAKSPSGEKPHDCARPRSMDIRSKLRDVHRQLPERTINILFVFHRSFGESKKYLTQALFGDSNFSKRGNDFVLEEEGLFYSEEWRNISACCLSRVNPDSQVVFPFIWKNPCAFMEIPKPVFHTFTLDCITSP